MTHTPFAAEELAFIRAIRDIPEDHITWLIYADWLDENDDPRAEFLRLTVTRQLMDDADPLRVETDARIVQLRAELDPRWMLIFDPAPVANCLGCNWNDLLATDILDIRICHRCQKAVFYSHALEEALLYAECGQKVAVSTRIPLEQIQQQPAFQPQAALANEDSDPEFEMTLEEYLGNQPDAEAPSPRPWWRFW